MSDARILFLDDDPVIRILRFIFECRENDRWLADYFAPERVDLRRLVQASRGLRTADGATVGVQGDAAHRVEDASIIVFRRGDVTSSLIDAHPSLRLVQRLGARSDAIDVTAARERGVRISCLPRRTLAWTAEHALLLMLALGKQLVVGDRAVREGRSAVEHGIDGVSYNWVGFARASGLAGRTLGIVGVGEVGTLVAKLASAFGMRVLYWKPRRADLALERRLGVRYAELGELLAESDYVSLHAPARAETENMAGASFFRSMKRTAYFVNTSRGRLVDETALYEALTSGAIAGAGLDVHAIEPRAAGDRLAALENVILTPHYAGGAKSGLLDELETIVGNCHAALEGGRIAGEVPADLA